MCCFTRPVKQVADTNIFARASAEGRQYLVYSMAVAADEDLAMVLPLPVPKRSGEDAVRFINLEGYPDLFADLRAGFPEPRGLGRGRAAVVAAGPTLKVVSVGSFEASYVPTVADFDRLDERFRMPDRVWGQLPTYRDFGFAVFKLKSGAHKVHPMAFEFPRARPRQLFFPTVHVHDGRAHKMALFDHALYCQVADGRHVPHWEESPEPAVRFTKPAQSQGVLDPGAVCWRQRIEGRRVNEDILV
jgi:hypothetical protein